jgi:TrpR-related protein YerC/YecD
MDEAKNFFRDLLTESELVDFGNRWKAARMLAKKIPYKKIVKATGFSSTTVARVAKWVKKGRGGYRLAFGRMKVNKQ